jgi:hypothetical protein
VDSPMKEGVTSLVHPIWDYLCAFEKNVKYSARPEPILLHYQRLRTPAAFAVWIAIASISAGDKQS